MSNKWELTWRKGELKFEDDYGFLTTLKNCFSIILQVKREKWKIDSYGCEENFIRSGSWKLLLIQGYMLFVINMNFYVPVFQLLTDSST